MRKASPQPIEEYARPILPAQTNLHKIPTGALALSAGPGYRFSMNPPVHLHYTDHQEWLWPQGESAIIGITDDLQKRMGPIHAVDFAAAGTDLRCGDCAATLHTAAGRHEVKAPISGRVLETNPRAAADSSLINQDPYGSGWLLRMRMEAGEEIEHLRDVETFRRMSANATAPTDSP